MMYPHPLLRYLRLAWRGRENWFLTYIKVLYPLGSRNGFSLLLLLLGSVVNCHKKVFTQFVRRAETDERQEPDTPETRRINTIINTAVTFTM